ncbi:MAG: hypothetical protein HY525_20245 [Betaproteobacteria bacterium]|nr:hypothetical protein [Betaproteobacteria bacterium]
MRPVTSMLLLCLVALAAAVILAATKLMDSQTAVGLLGVLIGAGISATTSILLARENRHLQLATAALDKRLAAHQAAYALWWKIVGAVHHNDKIGDVVMEADDWWKNNCLYLDADSRQAFRACLMFAFNHKDLLGGPRSKEAAKLAEESWKEIMKPGQTLVEGVALPSLGKAEKPLDIPDA